jgi:hypothetical protein
MGKYTVRRRCGHEEELNLYGHIEERDRRRDYETGLLCAQCYKLKLEEDRRKASEAAALEGKEKGLPDLVGTEKQIAWALRIRRSVCEDLASAESWVLGEREKRSLSEEDTCLRLKELSNIREQNSASWWINEFKELDLLSWHAMRNYLKDRFEKTQHDQELKMLHESEESIREDQDLLRPSSPVTNAVVEITSSNDTICLRLPEFNDTFITVTKKLHFGWDKMKFFWKRTLDERSLPMQDRVAETGAVLLASGFMIRVDRSVVPLIVSGNYERETTKWVTKGGRNFRITWREDDGNFNTLLNQIRGYKQNRKFACCVHIPSNQWELVLDFAEQHGFKIGEEAKKFAERIAHDFKSSLVVDIKLNEKIVVGPVGGPPKALIVPETVDVDDEFKDN